MPSVVIKDFGNGSSRLAKTIGMVMETMIMEGWCSVAPVQAVGSRLKISHGQCQNGNTESGRRGHLRKAAFSSSRLVHCL